MQYFVRSSRPEYEEATLQLSVEKIAITFLKTRARHQRLDQASVQLMNMLLTTVAWDA